MKTGTHRLLSILALSSALSACREEARLFNVFEPEAPVAEVPCSGSESISPWESQPVPVAEGLADVWGTSASDVWLAGGHGTVLHYDGSAWSNFSPDITVDLLSIHGTAPDDLWVVGRGGVAAHFDGRAWSEVPTGTSELLAAVWAISRDEVWIIGDEGVRRWSGAEFTRASGWPATKMNAIWAEGPSRIRIVGDAESYFFDGRTFATQAIEGSGRLTALWGTDADHIYTIGHNTRERPGFAVLGDGGWLFSSAPPRAFYFSLWALDPSDLWAGASQSTIFHRTGETWCREFIGGIGAVNALWGATGEDIWAAGAVRDEGGRTKPLLLRRRTR